jgi:hypothetical protein
MLLAEKALKAALRAALRRIRNDYRADRHGGAIGRLAIMACPALMARGATPDPD